MIKKYNEIPDWAQSFLSTCMPEMEKEAAVNVKTLPKVVWNDNTFFVALDSEEGNADVLNEYGNVVTALHNVKSIEDVEKQLNRQIVADIANNDNHSSHSRLERQISNAKVTKLDDELWKVAEVMNLSKTADDNSMGYQTTDPSINKSMDTATNTPDDTRSDTGIQQLDNADNSVNSSQFDARLAATEEKLVTNSKELKTYAKQVQDTSVNVKQMQKEIATYKKTIAKMQNTITKLAQNVKDLTDQIHAYTDPGNIYDLNCNEKEITHFQDTARKSARAIDLENSVDLTTPRGRTSLKDIILQDIDTIKMPEEILTEPDTTVNDSAVREQVEIVSVKPVSKVETKADTIVDGKDNVDIIMPSMKEDVRTNVNTRALVPVNNKFASAIKKRTCPVCGQQLFLDKRTKDMQDIVCKHCNTEFSVNLSTARIFKYS